MNWSQSLTQNIDRVIDKLQELIDKITGDLGRAISNVPDVEVGVRAPSSGAGGRIPDEGESPEGPQRAALGGVFEGPLDVHIERGRREMIGDVEFISRAMRAASSSQPAAASGPAVVFQRGAFEGAVIDSDARAEQIADRVIEQMRLKGALRTKARRVLFVISLATITDAGGTVDPAWPIANLFDGNPALPLRSTNGTLDLRFQFPGPELIWFPAIIHANASVLSTWKLQADLTNDFSTPEFELSFTPSAMEGNGYWRGLWADATSFLMPVPWWRLLVSGNADPVVIGELMLYIALLEPRHNYSWGYRIVGGPKNSIHETDAGSQMGYQRAPRRSTAHLEIETTDAGVLDLQNWHLAAGGRLRPFVVVLDPDSAFDDAWMVRFTEDELDVEYGIGGVRDVNRVRFGLREVGRGESWAL
jgi:hypothetical protein